MCIKLQRFYSQAALESEKTDMPTHPVCIYVHKNLVILVALGNDLQGLSCHEAKQEAKQAAKLKPMTFE